MKINIIHLLDRIERKERFEKDLPEQGAEYVVWDGITEYNTPAKNISNSHKRIVRWAKENGLPEVCIAEDDLRFFAKDAWKKFLEEKPQSFDMYLAGIYRGDIKENKTVDRFCGMHLYIISNKFYDTFLSVPETIDIDNALGGTGDFHVSVPFKAVQYSGWSDNVKRYADYDILLQPYKIYGK